MIFDFWSIFRIATACPFLGSLLHWKIHFIFIHIIRRRWAPENSKCVIIISTPHTCMTRIDSMWLNPFSARQLRSSNYIVACASNALVEMQSKYGSAIESPFISYQRKWIALEPVPLLCLHLTSFFITIARSRLAFTCTMNANWMFNANALQARECKR